MTNSIFKPVFASDLLSVQEHSCVAPKKGWGREHGGEPAHVLLVRRGVFCTAGLLEVMADPFAALIYDGAHGYRTRRPTDGGDDVTKIEPNAELAAEALHGLSPSVTITPGLHLKHLRLYAQAKAPQADPLAVEEMAVDLLNDVARLSRGKPWSGTITPAVARRLDEAKAVLADAPEADHRLADLARTAGCSPFHFARLFKRHTGHSARAYRLRLRLALAAHRLTEGERDLAGLAVDTGFSHHSHMTAAFKSVLGASPSHVRTALAG